jgi:hypothetical protein
MATLAKHDDVFLESIRAKNFYQTREENSVFGELVKY